MAAYTVVENDIALDVAPGTDANTFTHTAKNYLGRLNAVYTWIENEIGDDGAFAIDSYGDYDVEESSYIETGLFASSYIGAALYTGIVDTEITYYIDNEVSGQYTKAALLYTNVELETELTQYIMDNTSITINPSTDLQQRKHTNNKHTGIIWPRLYDWTGQNHGTFR